MDTSNLPKGFTAATCFVVICTACDAFCGDEVGPYHFVDLETAHQNIDALDWSITADGVLCDCCDPTVGIEQDGKALG
jgi:hypothetical protein